MFFAFILTSPFIVHSANISHNRDTTLMMHHSTLPIKSSKLTLKKKKSGTHQIIILSEKKISQDKFLTGKQMILCIKIIVLCIQVIIQSSVQKNIHLCKNILCKEKNGDGNLGVTQREKWFVLRRSEPLNITQSTVASNLITLQLISVNASLQTRVSLQTIFFNYFMLIFYLILFSVIVGVGWTWQ